MDNIQIKYKETIEKIEEEIECFHYMKDRLVSDVITGTIDVRNVVIPEYEYVEESDEDEDEVDSEDTEEQED